MIAVNDLRRQNAPIAAELKAAMEGVVESGHYILGEQVVAFEREFAQYIGTHHAVGAASGTDALQLALMGIGVKPGDEVITAANTCVPTVSAILSAGATPRLADVDPEHSTIDPESVEHAITANTRAIVPVHMYGHPCEMDALEPIAHAHGVAIVEDCAQAHGSRFRGRACGGMGAVAAFSFYPTKNLGALGDGGAVVTNDSAIAERIRALRQYGRTTDYEHPAFGINSRLDEMQAAVLRVKLRELDRWNAERDAIAKRYRNELDNPSVRPMPIAAWATTNHHLFVVRSPKRDALQKHLASKGIGSQIHYPLPIHCLEAYRYLGEPGAFPKAENACREVLTLPLYPGIPAAHVDAVIAAVNSFRP